MYEKFNNNESIVDLLSLINKIEEIESDLDEYCNFMKQTFLATSGIN